MPYLTSSPRLDVVMLILAITSISMIVNVIVLNAEGAGAEARSAVRDTANSDGRHGARGTVFGGVGQTAGFANHDWCEANYVVTPWCAEFWNTATSCVLLCVAVFAWAAHRSLQLEARFTCAFVGFGAVGAGSVFFHATLWHSAQLADELPMLWVSAAHTYIIVATEDKPGRRRTSLAAALFTGTVLVSLLPVFYPQRQDLFLLAFGVATLVNIFLSTSLHSRISDSAARRLYELGLLSYVVGVVLWLVERTHCHQPLVQRLQLHAWWHLCSALGWLYICTFWIYLRCDVRRLRPFVGGRLPLESVRAGVAVAKAM